MSLNVYNRKRKFNQTPEPRGKKAKSKGNLRFVVQMHDASRLHWDLRLEFDGSFKSWAVPKGPSLNPLDQRLAVFVEDHPLEYGSFEGIIPKGNYGAGTVMVWDEGTYIERGSEARKDSETAMIKNFEKGHITFVLSGKKLNGEFALIQLKKDKSQKAWLLVKKRDEYSTYKRSEIPDNKSAKTGRTMEEIAAKSEKKGDIWLSKRGKTAPEKKNKTVSKINPFVKKTRPKATAMPRKNKPMLATLALHQPDKSWILEPQTGGVRALSEVEGKRVHLYSKAGLPFENKYPKVYEELRRLDVTAVFDGEIVKDVYYIFDLLFWEDRDLRDEPLSERKKVLKSALSSGKHIKLIDSYKSTGAKIAKDPQSTYKNGTSSDWLIVGTTTPKKQTRAKPASAEPILTNLDKIYFPDDGITKGDLIEYYRSISAYILPYLKNRPESLNRQPNGIDKPGFYQKDMTGHIPRWLKTERVYSESADKTIDYVLAQDERSLLYLVNLGCIELNPWFSSLPHLDKPDFLVIDLDPDDNPFNDVIKIAHEVHKILDDIGAANFVKTSGATGIHIGVPTGAKYEYDDVRDFAEMVCKVVLKKYPAITSMERSPGRRRKKIYLDYMQNRRGQTLAAPFCVRPKPGAPVSMPVTWSELKSGLKPEQFNIQNALRRMSKFSDPWKGILGRPINLASCVKSFKRKYGKS